MSEGRELLLVDDDEIFAETLGRVLTSRGFSVRIAHNLAEAGAALRDTWPDYAIIDLRIGDDSGLRLVQTLADSGRDTRILVLTGFGSIATAVDAIKRGATQYLTKPAGADEIVAALADHRAGPPATPRERPLSVRRLEWEHIHRVLAENDGNISATARALGMHRRTLQRKLKKHPVRD